MTSRAIAAHLTGRSVMQGADNAHAQSDLEGLVKGAQAGESASFAQLYERFYDKIFRYVSFKTGNASEAEDIAEEVFLRMLESISTFRFTGPPFSSWLFRIAHNLVVDHFRRNGRRKNVPLDEAVTISGTSSSDMDRHLDVKLKMRRVNLALESLTDLQKEVITLRFAGGLSVRETAESVGKKENAVKALQHAGIKSLRRKMGLAEAGSETESMPVGGGGVADG